MRQYIFKHLLPYNDFAKGQGAYCTLNWFGPQTTGTLRLQNTVASFTWWDVPPDALTYVPLACQRQRVRNISPVWHFQNWIK